VKAKLVTAARAIIICFVIAVLAWSKSHGFTVIPYVPRTRTVERRLEN
jgi:hypothetical protein